ncbi:NADPH:quinone reductase [Aquiflexum balticum DSM 16537]|uniref:NADPH:quinone reductase n=1 Tax=Aquiflexum balticum DSM 16537 TaxID=758820 RepID=A0A1W2H0K1_9BACT|nr:zinc-binding dehydrogenase [Aquiflexum balticum]SMD42158.1 NADPH:quinone reductase [Aquiflexum balticum DSM 16537]
MKAILCQQHGTPETLVYSDVQDPEPNEKEVVILVKACAVNFPDVLIIQNKYQFKPELPFSPGGEVSGIIEKVGSEVKHLNAGQRVLALCGWGGFAEKVKVSTDRVFPIPPQMDYLTAASTLYTFGTSYHALKDRAQIKSGETLLILGASGGVGLATVELGKVMGATVIAAASTSEKLAICNEKGADFLINYEAEDLKEKIKELTDGKGVDVVLDVVGGKYAEPALRSMAWKGRYLVVGFAAGDIPKLPFNLALLKGCSVMGVFWGRFSTEEPKQNQQNIMELVGMIQSGKIRQHIYKEYSLEEVPQALRDMMDRKVVGKAMVVFEEARAKRQEPRLDSRSEKREARDEMRELRAKKQEPRQDLRSEEREARDENWEDRKVVFGSVGDLRGGVGKSLGRSSWTTVSQEVIQKFADATEDFQWIHVDTEKAKALIQGGKNLAHGYLTLSLVPKLLYEILPLEGVQMALNYGTNSVRFPAPVYSGDKVRLSATLSKVEETPDGSTKLFIHAEMESNAASKPVCVAEVITLVRF